MEAPKMLEIARQAVTWALKKGAREAAANAARAREAQVQWRDGRLDKIHEATTVGLALQLYVDGRYSAVSTSDVRPQAMQRFVEDAVALARALEKDPFRALPDPALYAGQASKDLMLEDPESPSISAPKKRDMAHEVEAAARAAPGAEAIISVTGTFSDSFSESYKVHSNGFEGSRRDTSFWLGADVSVKDPDGRKPSDGDSAGGCFFKELPSPGAVGLRAAERALRRVGAKKGSSGLMSVAIDPRCGGQLVRFLLGPLAASSLQQRRSMFEGKLGMVLGSPALDVADDPLRVKGLGSQLFDAEGIAARRLPLFEAGALRNFYVDTYYGKKLGMVPTTGRTSNLDWKAGGKSQAALLQDMKDGVLVTSFLGGSSNSATGDFSTGFFGFRVRDGEIAEPIAEMNLSGNHLDFWKRLVAVGNDPYPFSPLRTPTLVFEKAQTSGT